MPPSGKAQRPRKASTAKTKVTSPDSSPSRPAKRRKKTEESHIQPSTSTRPPTNQLPLDQPASEMDDKEQITSKVTQVLGLPFFVQVSRDHANDKHTVESRGGITAFAKLAGKGWAYYIKDLKTSVGRPANPPDGQDDGPVFDVHVDLGPSKMVSRQHASICYQDGWRVEVIGRNGVMVDHKIYHAGEVAELHSGAILNISGIEMIFVLPLGDFNIDPEYLQRADAVADDTEDAPKQKEETPDILPPPSTNGARGQNGAPQPIAPAPPNYQRPGTPPVARTKRPGSTKRSTPGYSAGSAMVMNDSENIDLSLDSNAHIKPGYSYSQMIAQAIIGSPNETLVLNNIYQSIMRKYAYYRHQPPHGWQNSIRHNLSLNKNYARRPREKDEPGKGSKWFVVPECYNDMKALAASGPGRGGGHRGGSSQPASPITTSGQDFGDEFSPESGVKRKRSQSSVSPRINPRSSKAAQFTPERAPRVQNLQDTFPGDGSPLPRHHRRPQKSTLGLSDNVPGSPPILSSSYQQDEGNTFVTPAPLRVHPHLAPPSTAQRPSQHMPTSSPAPFWKFAGGTATPLKRFGHFDTSPIKGFQPGNLPSSSPPQMRRGLAMSPTKHMLEIDVSNVDDELEEEEEPSIDLTKGFPSISSFHAAPMASLATPGPKILGARI